ncbi:hypothetical protein [Commensalibacter melissae]|uniref:hypothetical protein n=1 Tax=Commensalibacter melissae TaxID=2070537 RepID=UPI0012D8F3C8|nr:hypothetical protein [Commensalibacter melissae]MUG77169.1 hypothetical protein [Commensalibacter melissae]
MYFFSKNKGFVRNWQHLAYSNGVRGGIRTHGPRIHLTTIFIAIDCEIDNQCL